MKRLYSKIAQLGGWLGFADFCIFKTLIETQNELQNKNPLCEIGVHHGKSFIPMVLFSEGSTCHCVDVFENQKLNIDRSGKGDFRRFYSNLSKFNIEMDRVIIHKIYSTELNRSDLCKPTQSIRFFHIDGGHNFKVVSSDLTLALECSDKNSVIAIDDVCRSEWIEVSEGVFSLYSMLEDYEFTYLAFGFNKLYLCHKSMISTYQKSLYTCKHLNAFLSKKYSVERNPSLPLPIYSCFPLPEWSISRFLINFVQIKYPYIYISIYPLIAAKQKVKQRLKNLIMGNNYQ